MKFDSIWKKTKKPTLVTPSHRPIQEEANGLYLFISWTRLNFFFSCGVDNDCCSTNYLVPPNVSAVPRPSHLIGQWPFAALTRFDSNVIKKEQIKKSWFSSLAFCDVNSSNRNCTDTHKKANQKQTKKKKVHKRAKIKDISLTGWQREKNNMLFKNVRKWTPWVKSEVACRGFILESDQRFQSLIETGMKTFVFANNLFKTTTWKCSWIRLNCPDRCGWLEVL